jgi:hypothetical protein
MSLDRETGSATAGALGVGVVEGEPFTVQAIGEVQFGSCKEHKALLGDEQPDALIFNNLIVSLWA